MALLPQFRTNKAQTSNFDYSHRFRTTLPAGVCVPVLCEYGVPGQKFKIDLRASLKTLQTLAPVMGSFAVQFDIIWNNMSNYISEMRDNNWLGSFVDNDLVLPSLDLQAKYVTEQDRTSGTAIEGEPVWVHETRLSDPPVETFPTRFDRYKHFVSYNSDEIGFVTALDIDTAEEFDPTFEWALISPSSLWAYLGHGSGMTSSANRDLALGFLTYWDYIRNYVANPQEESIPVYGIGSDLQENTFNGIGGSPSGAIGYYQSAAPNSRVKLGSLDSFFADMTNNRYRNASTRDVLESWRYRICNGSDSSLYGTDAFSAPQLYDHFSGLAVRTYFPDYFTARLDSARVSDYIEKARVQVTDGSFTIDSLRFGNKLSKLLNLSLFSGGRFEDWQRAQWSVKPRHDITIPEIVGSFTMDISFDEIISMSGSETGSNPTGTGLGAVAGRMDDAQKSKTHYFETDAYGCFMIVASIIPRVGYSNNRSRHIMKSNLNDWYIPAFDRLGFQDLFQNELSCLAPINAIVGLSERFDQDAVYEDHQLTILLNGGAPDTTYGDRNVIGSQPAWMEYMTRTDRILGQFSEDIGVSPYWTLQPDTRNYRVNYQSSVPVDGVPWHSMYVPSTLASSLQDAINIAKTKHFVNPSDGSEVPLIANIKNDWIWSSYIDPQAVNALFPDQSRTAENFYLQIYFDFQTNMEKSKELLPSF